MAIRRAYSWKIMHPCQLVSLLLRWSGSRPQMTQRCRLSISMLWLITWADWWSHREKKHSITKIPKKQEYFLTSCKPTSDTIVHIPVDNWQRKGRMSSYFLYYCKSEILVSYKVRFFGYLWARLGEKRIQKELFELSPLWRGKRIACLRAGDAAIWISH